MNQFSFQTSLREESQDECLTFSDLRVKSSSFYADELPRSISGTNLVDGGNCIPQAVLFIAYRATHICVYTHAHRESSW